MSCRVLFVQRVTKSGSTGDQLKEATSINKALSALGGVIASLTSGDTHIPYRDHPLTMLMSDSIGGNAKTLMFVNCSPADYNSTESASSLQFGTRCKDVTNVLSGGSAVSEYLCVCHSRVISCFLIIFVIVITSIRARATLPLNSR